MPNLKLKLDQETLDALERRAISERRPADWQAEVILRQSLGLAFPYPSDCRPEAKLNEPLHTQEGSN
jgi:hypothetical protein